MWGFTVQRWVYSAAFWKEQDVWIYITEVCLQCSFLGERELRVYSACRGVGFLSEPKKTGEHSAQARSAAKSYLLADVKLLCLDSHTWARF